MQIKLTQHFEHTPEMSHYAYVVAFSLINIGLLWGRVKAMHVFVAPALLLILSGFMDIKHIYATAVNPSVFTVLALIALTNVLKKTPPFHRIIDLLGNSSRGVLIKSSLITATLSGFINNTRVVALRIPLLKAQERGWNAGRFHIPFSFNPLASASFLTPSSYQTHLMVMGPGNYSNQNFLTLGLGLPVLLVYTLTARYVLL